MGSVDIRATSLIIEVHPDFALQADVYAHYDPNPGMRQSDNASSVTTITL
jgi:hypothetical protein